MSQSDFHQGVVTFDGEDWYVAGCIGNYTAARDGHLIQAATLEMLRIKISLLSSPQPKTDPS